MSGLPGDNNTRSMTFTSNRQCELMGIVLPKESLFYFEIAPTEYGLHYYQITWCDYVKGLYKWMTRKDDE